METIAEFSSAQLLALTGARAAHYLAVAVWLGVMLFNLIIGFPMLRARATNYREYVGWLGQQGTRAAPWLYLLIALTAISGWVMLLLTPDSAASDTLGVSASAFLVAKHALLVVMLAAHLYATLRIWPRLFFALESEMPKLTLRYSVTIGVSATMGILAVLLSSYWTIIGN